MFDFAGNSLPYAPEYQATLIYTHTFELGNGASIVPRIRVSYFDDMFLGWENRTDRPAGTLSPTDPGESDFGVQPSYTMVDLSLGYHSANDQWYAEAFVHQCDGRGGQDRGVLRRAGDLVQVGRAQEYGVRFGYRYK